MKSTCIIDKYGTQAWRLPNGEMHRLDGPAYIGAEDGDNRKEWWVNGKLHRTDGPAVVIQHEQLWRAWYTNGKLHRTDGPAVVHPNGDQEWWVDGVDITRQVETWIAENNITWPWDAATQLEFVMRFC